MQAHVGMNTDIWVIASYIGPNGSGAMIIATCGVCVRERERANEKWPGLSVVDLQRLGQNV